MDNLFLFGASGDKPHEQYVISLSSPIVKYIDWKFRTEIEVDAFIARQRPAKKFVRVPGYRILLQPFYLSSTKEFKPLPNFPDKIAGTFSPSHRWSWLSEELQDAAQFYLTHKINPNAPKFNRYRCEGDEQSTPEANGGR